MLGIPSKDGGYLNISNAKLAEWESQFDCDVKNEIAKAADWLDRNQARRPKTLKFMENWLARARPSKDKTKHETVSFKDSLHPAAFAERHTKREVPARFLDLDTVKEIFSKLKNELSSVEVVQQPEYQPAECTHPIEKRRPCHFSRNLMCWGCMQFIDGLRPIDERDFENARNLRGGF